MGYILPLARPSVTFLGFWLVVGVFVRQSMPSVWLPSARTPEGRRLAPLEPLSRGGCLLRFGRVQFPAETVPTQDLINYTFGCSLAPIIAHILLATVMPKFYLSFFQNFSERFLHDFLLQLLACGIRWANCSRSRASRRSCSRSCWVLSAAAFRSSAASCRLASRSRLLR